VKKEDEAFDLLLESFTSSGNDEGVKILSAEVPEPPPVTVEADVTVESTNEEGRHLAENMEKEFDQIESTDQENDLKDQLKGEEEENTNPEGLQVTEEFLKKDEVSREEEVIEISSEESVEIREYAEDLTSEVIEEAESHVQERLEEAEDEVESPVKVEVTPPESPVPERKEVEVKEEVKELEEPKEEIEVVSEPKLKQVSFETPKESPKEFTITKEDIESSRNEEGNKSGKSIVAQNREIFEKSAPKGVKVKYSFRKEDATNSVETPEANKVSSLKNFFQNLGSNKGGSKDDSNAGKYPLYCSLRNLILH